MFLLRNVCPRSLGNKLPYSKVQLGLRFICLSNDRTQEKRTLTNNEGFSSIVETLEQPMCKFSS